MTPHSADRWGLARDAPQFVEQVVHERVVTTQFLVGEREEVVGPEKGLRQFGEVLALTEDALVKHPKARVYVMHAGWPHLDAMVAMLYQYPQLYVDVSWIDWYIPRAEFCSYLRRLVEAGFSGRIMFGSDQMQWPDAIGLAIERIASAPFLADSQKRDILYNNAARFFRLAKSGASPR